MPSQPSHGQAVSLAFAPDEWALLVRLPARVMITANSVAADPARRTVAGGIAGLGAIAAGRSSDSDLVRAVVAAIYAEPADEPPAAGPLRPRPGAVAEVLTACRTASAMLAERADPADAAAYRQWLEWVAARACGAARTGRAPDTGDGVPVSAAARRFLADLGAALRRQ